MSYKEYSIENKKSVDLKALKGNFIPREDFIKVHKQTIIVCADIMIWYLGGFLFIQRENVPVFGEPWVIGGRIERGISTEEGVRKKVKSECNLDLKNLKLLDISRTYFKTDPFGHSKGTDTVNFMYVAEGTGNIKLDDLHSNPKILIPQELIKIKSSLHPYIADFVEMALIWKEEQSL